MFVILVSTQVGATCLAARADVLDLLVATTRLAARSRRAADILQPPCVLDGTSVDAAAAAKILDRFPSFEKIHEAARNDGQPPASRPSRARCSRSISKRRRPCAGS